MRIAAVGDSVMWGQGLMAPLNPDHFEGQEKYFFKIVEWLQNEGKVQGFDMADYQAHSGAIIGDQEMKNREAILTRNEAPHVELYDRFYGEVPDAFPTVLKQLDNLKDGENIDILIINGGPNDVEILKSVDFSDGYKEGIRLIDQVARVKLPVLLQDARKNCPNAMIIYTGYYPALSEKSSSFRALSDLNIFAPGLRFIPFDEFFGGIFLATNHERLKRQGVNFHQRMLIRFREQIANFNIKRDPSTLPILFCPSGFGLSNAMFAPSPMIFTIEDAPEVTAIRKPFCDKIQKKVARKIIDDMKLENNNDSGSMRTMQAVSNAKSSNLFCENAFIAHPNKKGAEQYYKQLKKRIELQLKFSLRNHFKAIDSAITSTRKLKDKYPIIPLMSLRGLSDFYWMEVIAVNCSITTSNPNLLMKAHYLVFLNTVMFDFGSGYRQLRGEGGRFVLELSGSTIKTLNYLKIRYLKIYTTIPNIPPTATSSNISLEVDIQINGYQIRTIKLNRNSFKESGAYLLWETPKLNLEPENVY
jgi:hypothetical protein